MPFFQYKHNISSVSPPDVLILGCGLHSMLDNNVVEAPSKEKRLQAYAKQLRLIRSVRQEQLREYG